jgi:hypothetical protein
LRSTFRDTHNQHPCLLPTTAIARLPATATIACSGPGVAKCPAALITAAEVAAHDCRRDDRHRRGGRVASGWRASFLSIDDGDLAAREFSGYTSKARYYGYGARPAAWCGWEMRQLVSSDPGPDYNLASNWAHWGRSGPPGVGAVVVWSHHVGKIVGKEGGMWVIESGNDDHATRTRARPISGAIAIRWG